MPFVGKYRTCASDLQCPGRLFSISKLLILNRRYDCRPARRYARWGPYHTCHGCYDAEKATALPLSTSIKLMARFFRFLPVALLAVALGAAIDDYASVKRKLTDIESGQLRPGS